MDLLVDTHAVLWYITEDLKLPTKTKRLIGHESNNCFVSIASLWEIAIKNSLGRLDLNADLGQIFQIIDESGFELLPITTSHILQNARLEFHHYYPFDRIIIAQAIHENLLIITKDEKFDYYNAQLLWKK